MKEFKIYIANGLFSQGDRMFNKLITSKIKLKYPNVNVFLPQEQNINDKSTYANSMDIAQLDTNELLSADLLIAVIDGVEIDSGVACEIGIFSTTGKPILAIYTDIRLQGVHNDLKIGALINDATENQFMYRNLFVVGVIKNRGEIVHDVENLVKNIDLLI